MGAKAVARCFACSKPWPSSMLTKVQIRHTHQFTGSVPFLIRQLHHLARSHFLMKDMVPKVALHQNPHLTGCLQSRQHAGRWRWMQRHLVLIRMMIYDLLWSLFCIHFSLGLHFEQFIYSAPSCYFNSIMTRCCGSRKPPLTCCRGGPAVFLFFGSVAIGQPSRSEVQSLLAQAQFAMSHQAEDFRGSCGFREEEGIFLGEVGKHDRVELWCCIMLHYILVATRCFY